MQIAEPNTMKISSELICWFSFFFYYPIIDFHSFDDEYYGDILADTTKGFFF